MCTCALYTCVPWVGLDRIQSTDARLVHRLSSSATRALIIAVAHVCRIGASRFAVLPELSPGTKITKSLFVFVFAVRYFTDARLAALGVHEISLVIAIDACPPRSQAIDQSQRR